ncbi:AsnC family transcriptional regulator [Candidatus Marsarchaeota archaeon]|nr:AsnC family transcriptional regulator [Candidatus Marsarchaeota archaeon]
MRQRKKAIPKQVLERLNELRKNSKFGVTLNKIHGEYFAYEYKDVIESATGKRKRNVFYIGKISEDGTFVKRVRSMTGGKPSTMEEYLEGKYGKGNEVIDKYAMPSQEDLNILMAMSSNGRASAVEIARKLGLKPSMVGYRMKRLKQIYGIKTTINIRPTTFGFQRFMVLAKFNSAKPSSKVLKEILGEEPRIQLALLASGDFDLIIYFVAEDIENVEKMLYRIRSDARIAYLDSVWNVSYLYEYYGWYVPIREKFFELLESRVWHRTKDSPRRKPNELLPSEYIVMKEMSKDASKKLAEIDEQYGLAKGNADYTYRKLLKNETIQSCTICMENPHIKYAAFVYAEQYNIGLFNDSKNEYEEIIAHEFARPTNRVSYLADVSSPNGLAFITPIYEDGSLEDLIEEINPSKKGMRIKSAVITDTLLGRIGFRKFNLSEINKQQ